MTSRIISATINQRVKDASYAVRGSIALRALELKNDLKNPKGKPLPFKQTIFCNIGNPHQLKQKPLSFNRDVLSLMLNPDLKGRCVFPKDVLARARRYNRGIMGLGSYTESQGIPAVREEVAQSLYDRDGYKSDKDNIFLTNGASDGVRYCMQVFHRSSQSGFSDSVLAPIPQYPLYSAQTTLMGITLSPYYLDESRNWDCSVESVIEGVEAARAKGLCVRSVVIINPGNPTGQIMEASSISAVIAYCRKENICIFADEVYQANIWKAGAKFVSFRKVAHDMDAFSGEEPLQLVSFHSISKVILYSIV